MLRTPSLYTIPSHVPFIDALAQGIWERADRAPEKLMQMHILLPTRRACRSLREAFLKLHQGRPLLLPIMQPLGDVDEDEIYLLGNSQDNLELLPAIAPLKRQLLLARLIQKLPDFQANSAQAIAFAKMLGMLMDQIYTEDLSLKNLDTLVPEEFAEHWQVTVEFLKILSEVWPKILEENGVIDAADRRNRLLKMLSKHWEINPPQTPVIAAGSTGSIPSTALLLKTVAHLPQGCVVLPGLDTDIDQESWDVILDTHPQATLKTFLEYLEVSRSDVEIWNNNAAHNSTRTWLMSETMRPAQTVDSWKNIHLSEAEKNALKEDLNHIKRYVCKTSEQEALIIALALRDTLNDPAKTAALVSPDRNLARRVCAICKKWGIELDDSGGQNAVPTSIGTFIFLCAQICIEGFKATTLLALLKHPLCTQNYAPNDWNSFVSKLDKHILRSQKTIRGWDDIAHIWSEIVQEDAPQIVQDLQTICDDFLRLCDGNTFSFKRFLKLHITLCEELAQKETLWQGDAGETLSSFFAELMDHSDSIAAISAHDYLATLKKLMSGITIRPSYGTHPRLIILGQLEARLIQADTMILAGLNEGTWPADPAQDPWMSRPMRKAFCLPSPERSIGLSAHDFVQGFCSKKVIITRSTHVNGSPTLPSRWLERLDTVLKALEIDPAQILDSGTYMDLADALYAYGQTQPLERPAPKPPVEKRPNAMFVTDIENWMRDPYAIYAKHILHLRKLDDFEKDNDTALRGTLIHETLDKFVTDYPDTLPGNAENIFLSILREHIEDLNLEDIDFWWPRFEAITQWVIDHEKGWRNFAKPVKTEITGSYTVNGFTIKAKADRIDICNDNSLAIIDYKTGQIPTNTDLQNGLKPQLPLEAIIADNNGFEDISGIVSYIGFWKLSGAHNASEEKNMSKNLEDIKDLTKTGIQDLIQTFDDSDIPYISLPNPDTAPRVEFQDYAHLARVQEWSVLDDEDAA